MATPRIVAVGDSVMWGQGLAIASNAGQVKFADIVAEYLGNKMHARLKTEMLAHSGAVIKPKPGEKGVRFPSNVSRIARGEISSSFPTILEQLRAIPHPETVDLLLVDGGANDWGFLKNLANPFIHLKKMDANIRNVFVKRPKTLILEARSICKNAVIVYTGYYQGVSRKSPTKHIRNLILLQVGKLAAEAGGGIAGTAIAVEGHLLLWGSLEQQLLNKTYYWAHQQLRWLRTAVAECSADPALRGPGILFAHPRFGVNNALGAKGGESCVFSVVGRFAPDDQFGLRKKECPKVYKRLSLNMAFCQHAATFHPNPKGARRYARRIEYELERSGFTGGLKVSSLIKELSPRKRSLRRGLERYGLLRSSRPGGVSVRDMNQHLQVDYMEIGFYLSRRKAHLIGSTGPFDVGMLFATSTADYWTLTAEQGRGRLTESHLFQKAPHNYLFFVDPNLGDEPRVRGQALRLSDIRTFILKKIGHRFDLTAGGLVVRINGTHTIYDTGRKGINKTLTNKDRVWTAGQSSTPLYPARE